MGIVATGVGIQFAIEASSELSAGFIAEARTLLCGGIALFLIGVTLLQWASPSSLPKSVLGLRSLLAMVSLSLIPLGAGVSPWILVLALSLSLVALNRFDGIPLRST